MVSYIVRVRPQTATISRSRARPRCAKSKLGVFGARYRVDVRPPTTIYKQRARTVLMAAMAVVVLVSCSGGGGESESASTDGAALYERSCASCHGSDLRGTDRGPSHLSQVYAPDHHPDASFRAAITQGARAHHWQFGDMAPVTGLDDHEIDLIITYIREQQDLHGFEPYPPG